MDRVALITGASRGIGYSFAKSLLRAGYRVAITGARKAEALELALASFAVELGEARVMACLGDAASESDANRAIDSVLGRFGQLDILINNAGRGPRELSESFHTTPVKFWEAAPEGWDAIIQANIMGPFLMARAAVPHMIDRGWGRLIGVSTSRVTMIREGFAPYGPTKAALDTMTGIFAKELAGTGVTANILLPGGATDTDFIPTTGRSGHYLNLLPVEVMDDALLWLVAEVADGVTGARFVGKLWNPDDPSAAREDTGAPPLIL